jgi:hypothetical protein
MMQGCCKTLTIFIGLLKGDLNWDILNSFSLFSLRMELFDSLMKIVGLPAFPQINFIRLESLNFHFNHTIF